MAATQANLAKRLLQKLGVIGAGETPSADDQAMALVKLRAVHASLKKDGMTRWTLGALPEFAEEPYISMGAFLAASEFSLKPEGGWWAYGHSEIASGIQLRQTGTVSAEYF